ncbi:DUF2513 domain-containing protein [Bacillus haynesii]|uniref:DUF2513 domain-containing protein n=1 Tax=Bacillus haynesii TaxID=1925021 RepID=UPI0022825D9B|nr:DUF2513 domain-containing protein [Bacillus haynesii]MCY8738924.1 DUF2513 domain-containing protein [Bacillus haynesii]MCY9329944.1 DUF2513 domain-containing protein [Bacillus haynesii]
MELKIDCVRDILISIEKNLGYGETLPLNDLKNMPLLKNYDLDDVRYSLDRLKEENYIDSTPDLLDEVIISSLTFNGHQFLDSIRNDGIWKETKSRLAKIGGAASISTISTVASSIVKAHLGLS